MKTCLLLIHTMVWFFPFSLLAQSPTVTPGALTTPYGKTSATDVKQVMDRVLSYIDQSTPVGIVNGKTGKIIDLKNPTKEAALVKTIYNISSHEWGLTYAAMLSASETTGDGMFTLKTVECLGACGYAPMMQLGKNFREHLTKERVDQIIEECRNKSARDN